MKNLIAITLTFLLVLFASTAMAERGQRFHDHDYYASQGERIDRHLDRKGNQIERRFDHKADRAESKGKYRKADRMRAKGERINRHLDRKGDRIHSRHDRRYDKRHYQARSHRHYESRPRVAYRDHDSFDRYLSLAINQPGFSLGWVWYD